MQHKLSWPNKELIKSIIENVLPIILITILTACVTYSTNKENFVRPWGDLIQLNKTTEKQVIAVMGETYVLGDMSFEDGRKCKMLVYTHTGEKYNPQTGDEQKTAVFEFMDGVLVGHWFVSNFPEDSTDFDLTKVENIVENESTRQDVENLLGKPSGEEIYPLLQNPELRNIIYSSLSPTIPTVVIKIDKTDVVRHVEILKKK